MFCASGFHLRGVRNQSTLPPSVVRRSIEPRTRERYSSLMLIPVTRCRRGWSIVVLLCAALALCACAETRDDWPPYQVSDFFHHPETARSYAESWCYVLHLDDGAIIQVTFFRTDIGGITGSCGFHLWRMGGKGLPLSMGHAFSLGRYTEDRELPALHFGSRGQMIGFPPISHRISLTLSRGPGVRLDVAFGNMAPGFTYGPISVPSGRRMRDVAVFHLAIPRGSFAGSLTMGKESHDISGWGYAEHSYQSLSDCRQLARRWLAVLPAGGDRTLCLNLVRPGNVSGDTTCGFGFLADTNRVLRVFDNVSIEASDPVTRDRFELARSFDVSAYGRGVELDLRWNEGQLLQQYGLTEKMSWFHACLVNSLLGETIFYRSGNSFAGSLRLDGDDMFLCGEGFHETTARR